MKHKLIFGLSLVLIICIIFGVNNKKQNPEAATSNQKYYACITIGQLQKSIIPKNITVIRNTSMKSSLLTT